MAIKPRKGNFQNAIGDFGEDLARTSFSRPVRGRALFRATPLGGKYPVVDFIVDILDASGHSIGFFFVQVKSTSVAKANSKRLRIKVDQEAYNMLVRIPIPTYLVGVDTRDPGNEKVYLVAATRAVNKSFSSIRKDFDLSRDSIRVELYKEVASYWQKNRNWKNKTKSEFKNER